MATAQSSNSTQLKFLDGMRGLAALYVMIGHARYLLWEGYGAYKLHPGLYATPSKIMVYFFSVFRYGHEAVMFFFVLSGFVIHLKYAKRIGRDPAATFDFSDYLKRRAERLYPPVLFALLLTFLLDSYGSHLGLNVYSGSTPYEAINIVNKDRGLLVLLGNLFWLQRTFVPEFGSNGPLWSLMYEWWFYMLYPLFFLINRKSMLISLLIVILLCFFSFRVYYIQLVTPVLQSFILWYLGVILADIYAERISLRSWLHATGILLIPLVLFAEAKMSIGFVNDLLLAIGFASLLYTMQLLFKKGYRFKMLEKLQWLGECSFTLYVTHFPILFFCSGLLMAKYSGNLPVTQFYIVGGILLSLGFAYGLHFIIEKPFIKRRQQLQKAIVNRAL